MLSGNFDMNAGSIGENGLPNTATNGGGVYVAGGAVTINNGTVCYNTAVNGGGAYVSGGNLILNEGGSFIANTAESNGGGGYVDGGNFIMKNGTLEGSSAFANSAVNGGGIYVSDGNVTVYDGEISYNHASKDGGAIFVSSKETAVNVTILSGKLLNNTAGEYGGGVAVRSTSSQKIVMKIGCLLLHDINGNAIEYTGEYAIYSEDGAHKHRYCPQIAGNRAGLNGGGFFLDSSASELYYYCIEEDYSNPNIANGNTNCHGLDVEGGKIAIGDKDTQGNPSAAVKGNVQMYGTILVNNGQVDIYGSMNNPYFHSQIVVDIKDASSYFSDHRRSPTADAEAYKVHYFENFQGGGKYIANQYAVINDKCNVTISGSMFERAGYKIIGWNTNPDGYGYEYMVGQTYDLTESPGIGVDYECPICGPDPHCLVLYAVWSKKGYVIEFDSNKPQGAICTGEMENLPCTQGENVTLPANAFVCEGYRFVGWSLDKNATTADFADGATVKDLTLEDSKSVPLYAIWAPCTHEKEYFVYTADGTPTLSYKRLFICYTDEWKQSHPDDFQKGGKA